MQLGWGGGIYRQTETQEVRGVGGAGVLVHSPNVHKGQTALQSKPGAKNSMHSHMDGKSSNT